MERTLTAPLGCLTFGVHLNGYVRTQNGIELWVAKRSQQKPTFPGKLDNMVGGGQPAGLGLFENLLKECFEEAGISETQASQSIATGTISYRHTDGRGLKRDILYCYDLELPDSFVPVCQDGEVESFERLPIDEVLSIIETTDAFKYNCNLVIIDFAIRHGILTGDNTPDYAELCERRNQLAS
jgi:isopentenyldiphosphate isomerase